MLILDAVAPVAGPGAWAWLPLAVADALGLAALAWRPRWLPGIAAALLLGVSAQILNRAWQTPPGPYPGILDLLLFVSLSATIFIDRRAGDLAVGLILAALTGLAWRHPWLVTDYLALKHSSDLVLLLLLMHLVLRAYWQELQACVTQLAQATASLAAHADQIADLSRTAFDDFRSQLLRLDGRLSAAAPDASASAAALSGLEGLLQRQRASLADLAEPPALQDGQDRLLALRTRIQARVLTAMSAAMAVALLRNILQSGLLPPTTLAGVAVFGGAALLRQRSPAWGPWAFRGAMVANQWMIFAFDWAHRAGQPTLFSANNNVCIFLIFLAALLDGPATGALLLAGEAVALAAFAAAGLDIGGSGTFLFLGFGLLTAGALWMLPRDLLDGMGARRRQLQQAERHRRRLLCTLFHDLANPLQAIGILVDGHSDLDRARELCRRMEAVLQVTVALEDKPLAVQPVDLPELAWSMETLFRERLAAKSLTLSVDSVPCRAWAEPSLLGSSVLGNLMGNAVKFSPPGGRLRLSVEAQGPWAQIQLKNPGPPISADAINALHQGRRITSMPGSRGEAGTGFGLGQIQDYVLQMGGEFSIEAGPDGGTVATVRLRIA